MDDSAATSAGGTLSAKQAIEAAEAAVERGDLDNARRTLLELVDRIGEDMPMKAARCWAAAQQIGAPELAIHYALCFYVATSARRDAVQALAAAASQLAAIADAADRISTHRATPQDYVDVAAADPFARWPQIAAFTDQVTAFSEAEMVVAPHGAGLVNSLFAAPGAHVIELGRDTYPGSFRTLAAAAGLHHALIPCDVAPQSQDLVVDANELLERVRRVGGAS